jgi:hypothetical protein
MKNSKSEARNPKQIRMTEIQNFKQNFLVFEHSNFGFVSSFDIRISNLWFWDVT